MSLPVLPALSIAQRAEALSHIVDMMEAADAISQLGFKELAREKYREIADMMAIYRERVAD
jgi:hypothetical protein